MNAKKSNQAAHPRGAPAHEGPAPPDLHAVGCTKIDYVGKQFAPTTDVAVFFSLDDVDREYDSMGRLTATANDIVSAKKCRRIY